MTRFISKVFTLLYVYFLLPSVGLGFAKNPNLYHEQTFCNESECVIEGKLLLYNAAHGILLYFEKL